MKLRDFNLKPSDDECTDGLIDLPWYGEPKSIRVYFEREGEEPSAAQLEAFNSFIKLKEETFQKLEAQLFEYYAQVRIEASEYYEEAYFKETYPPVSSPKELSKRLKFKNVLIGYYDEDWSSYIGLVIDCDWDIDNGVGVKIEGNKVVEIGEQDIVL